MKGKHSISAAVFVFATITALTATPGQQPEHETDSAKVVRHSNAEANLAKASQNPVANMVSLPLQWNYSTAGGLDSSSEILLNVQPVLPLPIGKRFLIVSRTVVPFLTVPLPFNGQASGIADIQEQAYFVPAHPGKFTWGLGPIFSFPTATNIVARTGQWGLGPTAVGVFMPGNWVIGALVNNIWRIGGTAHHEVLNSFTTQPFINYNLPHAWSVATAPLITSNWSAPSGQRWTVPIGAGVAKVTHVLEQPLNLQMEYYHNASHPRAAGSEQLRFTVAALWPTAAAEAARKKDEAASKKKAEKPE